MPEHQPVYLSYLSAIERPRCPVCNHPRMLLSRIDGGPSGCDRRTFECQSCGRVQTRTASRDPMESSVRSWLGGGLKPPHKT
jgi:transposase-like protein